MTLPQVKSAIRIDPNDTEEQTEWKWNEFLRDNPTFVSVSPDIIPDWFEEHKWKYGWKPTKRTQQEKEQIAREADALLEQYLLRMRNDKVQRGHCNCQWSICEGRRFAGGLTCYRKQQLSENEVNAYY